MTLISTNRAVGAVKSIRVYTYVHVHVKGKQPDRSGKALRQNSRTATTYCSLDPSHTHMLVFLTPVRYTCRHHLSAFWVSTESKASWESYVTFLASALPPALDL